MKKVKLNLGCGRRWQKGFINVDHYIVPNKKHKMFVKADLTKKLPFKDDYADYIIMNDVIEHFGFMQVVPVLKEIKRILKPGGQFIMLTTDFADVVLSWLDMFNRGEDFNEYMRASMVIYGNQLHAGEFHKIPFTPTFMNRCMQEAGFTDYKLTKFFKGTKYPKIEGDPVSDDVVLLNNMLMVDATK